ncbi:SGNH/GDSL hydrolase family protein [Spirosoma pollinicola]|uniref:SGNH/GDSL hydrolase family protein n=1 Tax=Spirosoma pollinicola TaxID=2057025 RepID=UPI001F0BCD93|nr:SGNH/GDSL hydrolase family protein [Spirosoma pollinicola]
MTEPVGGSPAAPSVPEPTPTPQSLAAPVFTPQSGAVAFGSTITLSASALPDGAVVEYSTDNGTTWVAGNQIIVNNKIDLIGRVRLGDKTTATGKVSFIPYFQRMLVIGNSIMNHGPAPDLGWFNNNGMAASAPEKDFVHLLTGQLQTLYAGVAVKLQSSGSLERQYGMSNYSIDEFNEPVQQFKPDLILVRMGENVDDSQVQARNFETSFRAFLERLVLLSGSQPVKIVCTTSVWSNPQADAVIRKVANEKGYTLVDLSSMVGQGQYFASQYANGAVAAHPNDAGMQRIDELIWEKLK